jgi:hypothetical protein
MRVIARQRIRRDVDCQVSRNRKPDEYEDQNMSAVKDATHDFASEKSGRLYLPWRKIGIYLAAVMGIFLLGLVPMWFKAREAASQRDAAQRELRLSQMQNTLGSAVIDARRGEYETARQTASDFFTTLREQMDAQPDKSVLTVEQRQRLKNLITGRDDVITLLARSDPAAADRLSDMYVSYSQAMSKIKPAPGS